MRVPVTSRAMPAGAMLLVGSPMPDRSKGRSQRKSDPLVLQVGGWGKGLITLFHKKTHLSQKSETEQILFIKALCATRHEEDTVR